MTRGPRVALGPGSALTAGDARGSREAREPTGADESSRTLREKEAIMIVDRNPRVRWPTTLKARVKSIY